MLLRDVAGLDGGVRETCFAVIAWISLVSTAEAALDVANECREEWNVLGFLFMSIQNRNA